MRTVPGREPTRNIVEGPEIVLTAAEHGAVLPAATTNSPAMLALPVTVVEKIAAALAGEAPQMIEGGHRRIEMCSSARGVQGDEASEETTQEICRPRDCSTMRSSASSWFATTRRCAKVFQLDKASGEVAIIGLRTAPAWHSVRSRRVRLEREVLGRIHGIPAFGPRSSIHASFCSAGRRPCVRALRGKQHRAISALLGGCQGEWKTNSQKKHHQPTTDPQINSQTNPQTNPQTNTQTNAQTNTPNQHSDQLCRGTASRGGLPICEMMFISGLCSLGALANQVGALDRLVEQSTLGSADFLWRLSLC